MQFSSDGLIIAVNSYPEPQNTQLMNANDGSLINTLEGNKPIFSLDGLALITWSSDHLLKWNIQDGTLISSQQYSQTGNPTGHVDQVSFSPDGLNLAAFQRDPEMFDSPGEISNAYPEKEVIPLPFHQMGNSLQSPPVK
jgi:WD40 repeat protein